MHSNKRNRRYACLYLKGLNCSTVEASCSGTSSERLPKRRRSSAAKASTTPMLRPKSLGRPRSCVVTKAKAKAFAFTQLVDRVEDRGERSSLPPNALFNSRFQLVTEAVTQGEWLSRRPGPKPRTALTHFPNPTKSKRLRSSAHLVAKHFDLLLSAA